jgi:hypothetical protein
MKKIALALGTIGILIAVMAYKGEEQTPPPTTKYVVINAIESTVQGGLGRSRILITKEDGSQEDKSIENLFSLVGINFGNIKQNDLAIINMVKTYTDAGWKIHSITPLSITPGPSATGIFMTRYLLTKEM